VLDGRILPSGFTLTSPGGIPPGGVIPAEFAAGRILENGLRQFPNMSPPLTFTDPPASAKSFALIMYDKNSNPPNFVHWVIYNIPAEVGSLPAGVFPLSNPFGAIQGFNGNSEPGYLGPNPQPPGSKHDYVFRLYALDTMLTFPLPAVTAGELRAAMNPPGGPDHIVGRAVLEGNFQSLV
jgi:Raf kinase inhibitor-like YbhB/YbcL family protein